LTGISLVVEPSTIDRTIIRGIALNVDLEEEIMSTNELPVALSPLLSLAAEWALPTEAARKEKRATSTMEQLKEFYDRVHPRVVEIGAHLDRYPMGSLPRDQERLFQLALMAVEVAMPIEFYRLPDLPPPAAFPRDRFLIATV